MISYKLFVFILFFPDCFTSYITESASLIISFTDFGALWKVAIPILKVTDQPFAAALYGLLEPLGLDYRVVDEGTIQVSTRKAVAATLELEFYPIRDLLRSGQTGEEVVKKIEGSVAGSTWSDAGGPGVLHFDGPSACLIVLQSQPVQADIERLLAEQRDGEPEP